MQPDIQTLQALAAQLGAAVGTLLYGRVPAGAMCTLVGMAADIHMRVRGARILCFCLGACALVFWGGVMICAAIAANLPHVPPLLIRLTFVLYRMPYLAALPAVLLYFGLIRR